MTPRSSGRPRALQVRRLGRVEYADGLQLMDALAKARTSGALSDDVLLLLEHPPVITHGRAAKASHVLASAEELSRRGVELFETNRGGDVTWHGPGQLVAYPILDLKPDRCDVHRYVRDLEEAILRTLADYHLAAARIPGWTGVWLGTQGIDARKVAAIGVHLSRWVTTHGLALNVSPDMSSFGLIIPCGISGAGVTSLAQELSAAGSAPVPTVPQVADRLAGHLGAVFERKLRERRPDRQTVSVAVLRAGSTGPEALILLRHPHRGGFWQPVTGTQEPGETARHTAKRELGEETGITSVEPVDLGYRHSFAFEGRSRPVPQIFEETAFGARIDGDPPIALDRREHQEHAWVSLDEAVARVPHRGLKRALRLAAQKLF